MRRTTLTNGNIDFLINHTDLKDKYDYLRVPPVTWVYRSCCGGLENSVIDYNVIRWLIAEEPNILPILDALETDALEITIRHQDNSIEVVVRVREE